MGVVGKSCAMTKRGAERREELAARDPHAADRHALTCKCGGKQIHTHDNVCGAFARVGAEWGVPVRVELKRDLPPNMRIDCTVTTGGDVGTLGLAVDWTRRIGEGQVGLRRAETEKERKYDDAFQLPMTVRGAAFSEFGELGPHAMEVVERLVGLGRETTGSHPDDLRLELLTRLSAAIIYGNAASIAYFAGVNRKEDRGHAPLAEALKPMGMRLATGVRGRLAGGKQRGRRRPPRSSVGRGQHPECRRPRSRRKKCAQRRSGCWEMGWTQRHQARSWLRRAPWPKILGSSPD